MAEGQRERDWSLLSNLMALIANCHRSSKNGSFDKLRRHGQKESRVTKSPGVKCKQYLMSAVKPFKPADFNPTIEKTVKRLNRDEFRRLCKKYFKNIE